VQRPVCACSPCGCGRQCVYCAAPVSEHHMLPSSTNLMAVPCYCTLSERDGLRTNIEVLEQAVAMMRKQVEQKLNRRKSSVVATGGAGRSGLGSAAAAAAAAMQGKRCITIVLDDILMVAVTHAHSTIKTDILLLVYMIICFYRLHGHAVCRITRRRSSSSSPHPGSRHARDCAPLPAAQRVGG